MKKKINLFIVLILVFTLLASTLAYGTVNTKLASISSIPKFTIINNKTKLYSFDQSFDMADLIALVKISQKASVTSPQDKSTVFTANILKTYKIKDPSSDNNNINIIQHGTVNYSYNGYPLFKKNDQMIVFLKKAPGNKNTYSIIGDEANTFKVVTLHYNTYIVKLYGNDPQLSKAEVPYLEPNEINHLLYLLDKNGKHYDNNRTNQILDLNGLSNLLSDKILNASSKFITAPLPIHVDNSLIHASNEFGLDIFKTEVNGRKDKNIILSPISLFTAFNVVLNGATGTTREQLKDGMKLKAFEDDQLNPEMNKLINAVGDTYPGIPGTTKIFNSLWINKNFSVKNSFIDIAESYYGSDTFKKDFGNPGTIKDMNNWINQKSAGLIKNPIDEINKETRLDIFNILYFVGKWSSPFNKAATKTEPFTTSSGSSINVSMMNAKKEISYYEDDEVKVGSFGYYNGNMMVLLPKGDIHAYTDHLTIDQISKYNQELKLCEAKVKMPKMNLSYKNDIVPTLNKMGIVLPFDSNKASFDNIKTDSSPLWIGKVEHQCVLKSDEDGTEAAALTDVLMAGASRLPTEIKEFYINKPFLFLIESSQNVILFMGKVETPS